ncbi:MAG TPA: hypothetical protein VJK05_05905 [archaeon]|nr:hypothetical protein [archaeon]
MGTTIAVSSEIRDDLKEFGFKGESYNDVLKRLLEMVKEKQLQEILMNEKDTVTARSALERAKTQWQK